jgi:hypothetical protein
MLWSEGLLLVWTGAWPLPVGVVHYSTRNTPSEVFVVLDAPKAPMSPAWVSLLRYSCRWAAWTNNLYDAARAVTFGVFYQRPGFAYPEDSSARWTTPRADGSYTYMLKAVISEWQRGQWISGNCVDVSFFTMLASCAVGMDFSARRLATTSLLPPSPQCGRENCPNRSPHFHTNMLCPIGSDPTPGDGPREPIPPYPDYTYRWYSWAWHQVCSISGAADIGAGIWDPTAAQKLDLFGSSYRNPAADHPSCRWIQEGYWQTPRMPGAILGLVNEPWQADTEPVVVWIGKCAVSAEDHTPSE